MGCLRCTRIGAPVLALAGLLLPAPCLEAVVRANEMPVRPDGPPPAVTDMTLARGGVLKGQVRDTQGSPLAQTKVELVRNGRPIIATVTASDGRFALSALRGGVYQVTAGGGTAVIRAWASNTAPPGASQSILIVSGGDLIRGQRERLAAFLTNPWILTAMVALAIGIPVAVQEYRRDSTPSS